LDKPRSNLRVPLTTLLIPLPLMVFYAVVYNSYDAHVYGTDRNALVLMLKRRTEQNLLVCSGKSEVEVTNN